jgi:DNA-binding MarR family transcriptional regulator
MATDLAKDNLYMTMVINILRTANIIDHKVSEVLKEFEITHIQFNILRILEAAHPEKLSVGDIYNGLLVPTSDVTRLLDRLEKRDLIIRSLCPENRRKMDISISEIGLKVIASSLPKMEEKLEGFYCNQFSERERDKLIELLKRINS